MQRWYEPTPLGTWRNTDGARKLSCFLSWFFIADENELQQTEQVKTTKCWKWKARSLWRSSFLQVTFSHGNWTNLSQIEKALRFPVLNQLTEAWAPSVTGPLLLRDASCLANTQAEVFSHLSVSVHEIHCFKGIYQMSVLHNDVLIAFAPHNNVCRATWHQLATCKQNVKKGINNK